MNFFAKSFSACWKVVHMMKEIQYGAVSVGYLYSLNVYAHVRAALFGRREC
jgi:hypothetical protein